jgi:hypothetical protein
MTSPQLRRPDQLVVERLVRELTGVGDKALLEVRARARSLPTMIRRHGPIQVLLFLESKGKDDGASPDRQLAGWLRAGVDAVLPLGEAATPTGYAEQLAARPLDEYLFHWQTCVEVAAWLKRLVEARTYQAVAARNAGPSADRGTVG